MSTENSKQQEIKRLSTPLKFQNSKAYDSNGNILNCTETIHDVRYIVEPKDGILSDEEILQYAPKSKSASKVRLKRGFGSYYDVLLIHESLPWILAIYYVILISISFGASYVGNRLLLFLILILIIVPLIYLYYIFNLNNYIEGNKKHIKKVVEKVKPSTNDETVVSAPVEEVGGLDSLKNYEKEINNLKVLFDVKEEVVRDLIKKRFTPPQITYDKFIAIVDSSHKLFYRQNESALNIINLAAEDTPRVQNEIQNKIDAMKKIIDQIEELTNELVISMSNDDVSENEVDNLLDDMENLIDSVKKY